MFKSKEELIKNDEWNKTRDYSTPTSAQWKHGFNRGVEQAFSSISERFEFYEKYHIKPNKDTGDGGWNQGGHDRLRRDKPDIHKIFKNKKLTRKDEYNNWLFHFCFDGVK